MGIKLFYGHRLQASQNLQCKPDLSGKRRIQQQNVIGKSDYTSTTMKKTIECWSEKLITYRSERRRRRFVSKNFNFFGGLHVASDHIKLILDKRWSMRKHWKNNMAIDQRNCSWIMFIAQETANGGNMETELQTTNEIRALFRWMNSWCVLFAICIITIAGSIRPINNKRDQQRQAGRHHCNKGQAVGGNYAQSNGRGSQPTGTVGLGRLFCCWLKCTEWETHIIILIGSWVTDRRVISGGSPNSNRGSQHHDGGYNKIQSSPP